MPANELNETTILDDQTLNFGTSKDVKIAFDSTDNRLEFRDSTDAVIGYLTLTGGISLDNALFGGGYGSTGATISNTGNISADGNIIFAGHVRAIAQAATIASGAITATSSYVIVDTESAAATDDLDTINGGADGMLLTLLLANSARDVVIKNNTGNIRCGADITLGTTHDTVQLIFRGGSGWKLVADGTGN